MSVKTYDHVDDTEEVPTIHQPTSAITKDVLAGGGRVCGECKYFSLREGQRLMEAQKFVQLLVKEHKWNVKHLGAPPDKFGDCGARRSGSASDDTMITPPMAVACSQFVEKR